MNYNPGNYDKYMSKNPLKRLMVQQFNNQIINEVNSYAEKLRSDTSHPLSLLDAGCGEGFISNLLYHNINNVQITGIEYTFEALTIAKKNNKQISFIQGDIYKLPFEENSFDFVICTEVLEHLENPSKAVKEIFRVAKSAILLSVPNEPWFCLGNLLVLKNVKRLGNPIDHINHWSYTEFIKYIKGLVGHIEVSKRSYPWTIVICQK